MEDYAEDFSPELESTDDLMSEEDEAGSASDQEPDPEPEAPEEVASDPEPEAPEEEPSEPEPEAPEEEPSDPEPEAPEEEPSEPEPEAPPTEETEDGSESMKDLIDAIGDLNETITGAVTQEPEELPAGGEGGGGGFGGESQVTESASVDLAPVVQVLERNEKLLTRTTELLEQQGEVLVMQHNDLLQLQAMVTNSISMISAMVPIALTLAGTIFLVKKAMSWFKGMAK